MSAAAPQGARIGRGLAEQAARPQPDHPTGRGRTAYLGSFPCGFPQFTRVDTFSAYELRPEVDVTLGQRSGACPADDRGPAAQHRAANHFRSEHGRGDHGPESDQDANRDMAHGGGGLRGALGLLAKLLAILVHQQ